jgi:hypothetical protein
LEYGSGDVTKVISEVTLFEIGISRCYLGYDDIGVKESQRHHQKRVTDTALVFKESSKRVRHTTTRIKDIELFGSTG